MRDTKSRLLTTTALVAAGTMVGGTAYAEMMKPTLSLGGYYYVDAHFTDVDGRDDDGPMFMVHDMEIHFNAAGEMENGLKVTGHVEFEGAGGARVDDHWITISNGWGKVLLGATDAVTGKTQVTAPASSYGVTSGLQTEWFPALAATGCAFRCSLGGARLHAGVDDTGIHYFSPSFNGFSFAVGYRPDAQGSGSVNQGPIDQTAAYHDAVDTAVTYKGALGGVGISASAATGVAAAGTGGADMSYVTTGMRLSAMGFTVGGHMANEGTDSSRNGNSFGLGLSWSDGPLLLAIDAFSGSIRGTDAPGDHEYDAWAIGGQYTVGPGLRLIAGFQNVSLDMDDADAVDGSAFSAGVAVNF